ncbi:MAG TPA: hypothetical protein VF783_18370, partial [Terriglobales bacterium]
LEEQQIDFTRSRPRHCNDNALAESKNGNVVRRQFGYSHVPATRAAQCYVPNYLSFSGGCLSRERRERFFELRRKQRGTGWV